MLKSFKGPIFLVGMPRSGTKLLRDLLNRNLDVGIHSLESDFIPHMVNKFGINYNFSSEPDLRLIYNDFCKTGFFLEMINRGKKLDWFYLVENIKDTSWAGFFELIFRFYAPSNRNSDFIWGDKTPGYLNQLPLLKSIFPQAKFIHIIRDPRDYSLSVGKAWNKNAFRAAERWRHTIEKARLSGNSFPDDYYEIKYEELLSNPKKELEKICHFIGCAYSHQMESLLKPSEILGDAKGASYIVSSNSEKYLKEFTQTEIRRIEEITLPVLKTSKYVSHYGKKFKPLNSFQKLFYQLLDGAAIIRFYSKNGSRSSKIFHILNNYRKSSWR